ncbi:MAG: FkbM family methyltransferase [Candidatus Kapaibacterium sp.]
MSLKKTFYKLLTKSLSKHGYTFEKINIRKDYILRRIKLLNYYNIDLVLDIGANVGQYAEGLFKNKYRGDVISFEPLKNEFNILESKAKFSNNWKALNYAFGNTEGKGVINIAGNTDSSSLLDMLPIHEIIRPSSKYIGKEDIYINKIDSVFNKLTLGYNNVFVKIDAQGYEFNILEGGVKSLKNIVGLQLEMSFDPLYKDEKLLCEIIGYLSQYNFKLMSIEPGTVDYNTGRMYQIDGIYFKD